MCGELKNAIPGLNTTSIACACIFSSHSRRLSGFPAVAVCTLLAQANSAQSSLNHRGHAGINSTDDLKFEIIETIRQASTISAL